MENSWKALALIGALAAALLCTTQAQAAGTGANSFDSSTRVQVATHTATQLYAADRSAMAVKLKVLPINGSTNATTDAIAIGTSATFADYSKSDSTGTVRIMAADGWVELGSPSQPYQGPLYGVALSTGPLTVERMRLK